MRLQKINQKKKVFFLGYIISKEGVKTTIKTIKALKSFQVPKVIKVPRKDCQRSPSKGSRSTPRQIQVKQNIY